MSTREVLEAAKARIDKPQKWHRGSGASKDGKRVCAYIAIEDVGGATAGSRRNAIALLCGTPSKLIRFNDAHTHDELMARFNRAIARAA